MQTVRPVLAKLHLTVLVLASGLLGAQEPVPANDEPLKMPGLLWTDARSLAAEPERWAGLGWGQAALGAVAVLGTAVLLDRGVDRLAARGRLPGRDRVASGFSEVGGAAGLALVGAGYLGSAWAGHAQARSLFADLGLAAVLAQVAVLPLKAGVGRARPLDGEGAGSFQGFSGRDGFPSGHATQAFAMAAALSARSQAPWVGWCAYTGAGLVSLSRVATRQHYLSDVVAGGLVGTYVGRGVVRVNAHLREGRNGRIGIRVNPLLLPGQRGIALQVTF